MACGSQKYRGHSFCPSGHIQQYRSIARLLPKHGLSHTSRFSLRAASPAVVQDASTPGAPGSSERNPLKRLILLRHADSETGGKFRDHDRPISSRGRKEAATIAERLIQAGCIPDLVVASDSKRTKQTLEEMASVIEGLGQVDAHYYGSLYTVAALDGQTRQVLQKLLVDVASDGHKCVMCVGHNKGWEEAASSFAGKVVKLKTASAAVLQCVADSWTDVLKDEVKWELIQVITPSTR